MSLENNSDEAGEKWYFGYILENWGDRVKIVTVTNETNTIFGEDWEQFIDDVEDVSDEPLMLIKFKRFDEDSDEWHGAIFLDVKRSRLMSDNELRTFLTYYGVLEEEIQIILQNFPGYYLD